MDYLIQIMIIEKNSLYINSRGEMDLPFRLFVFELYLLAQLFIVLNFVFCSFYFLFIFFYF
jgi:hypothetical protein